MSAANGVIVHGKDDMALVASVARASIVFNVFSQPCANPQYKGLYHMVVQMVDTRPDISTPIPLLTAPIPNTINDGHWDEVSLVVEANNQIQSWMLMSSTFEDDADFIWTVYTSGILQDLRDLGVGMSMSPSAGVPSSYEASELSDDDFNLGGFNVSSLLQ